MDPPHPTPTVCIQPDVAVLRFACITCMLSTLRRLCCCVLFFCGGGGVVFAGFCCRCFFFVCVCFLFLFLFVLSVCLVLFVNCFV